MEALLSQNGRIFDIQRFSMHDGPGIRTVVFLKGCVLRCRWCCNPESQAWEIQTMLSDGKPKTVGRDVTAYEVLAEVAEDRAYYQRSGGGMTLSGGEAMCQPKFAEALLRGARAMGIDTAIETTACVDRSVVASLVPHIDHVLMDIKHMDSAKHRLYTGQPNELILENARYIAEHARELIIRVPVIPSFNDTPEEIAAIATFANALPNVTQLHLLPYHRLGADKYKGLGRAYALDGVALIEQNRMQYLLEIASESGLLCRIGG